MRNLLLIAFVFVSLLSWGQASNTERITALEQQVSTLQNETWQYKNDLMRQLNALKKDNDSLRIANDSLKNEQANLAQKLSGTETQLNGKIEDNSSSINNRTWGGGAIAVALLLLGALLYWLLGKRLRKSNDGMESIKEAQNALEKANKEIQEKSIGLDNKLIELLDKQIQQGNKQAETVSSPSKTEKEIDHSLAKKVADEIVRIETNLSRMDPTVKGHKQLSRAVERIRNNFLAQGYEIVDMLGKPYIEGMKATTTVVPDESLEPGQQIITGIKKPQINYNGEMIQVAEITVSQNI